MLEMGDYMRINQALIWLWSILLLPLVGCQTLNLSALKDYSDQTAHHYDAGLMAISTQNYELAVQEMTKAIDAYDKSFDMLGRTDAERNSDGYRKWRRSMTQIGIKAYANRAKAEYDLHQEKQYKEDIEYAVNRSEYYVNECKDVGARYAIDCSEDVTTLWEYAYLVRAEIRLRAGDHDAAVDDCNRVIKQGKEKRMDAHFWRAQAFFAKQRYSDAIRDYTVVIDNRHALAPYAHEGIGRAQLNMKQVAAALPHFEQLTQAKPDYAKGNALRGYTIFYLAATTRDKRYTLPDAERYCQQAVRLDANLALGQECLQELTQFRNRPGR